MGISRLFWLLAILSLCACAASSPQEPPAPDRREVVALSDAILALGPGVDPEEAERAARIAFSYSRQLAREYRITDPPLIHNAKINLGLRERGLCYHWAEDIEARLLEENFRTLVLHRAISPDRPFRIEHSTAVISRKGDGLHDGVVLDPWRMGGRLFWSPVREDTAYDWQRAAKVLDARWHAREARRQRATASP
ncbi:hypothetical protein [Pararhodobacter sp. SW119]|uniref:hypothetical protein n=1 Tax=Pararhodobacter sp. SW119 TaxID=2780075 RepID=UPI001FD853BF|nr:hypothetical protein [Pararhodobacter sp. SW119]